MGDVVYNGIYRILVDSIIGPSGEEFFEIEIGKYEDIFLFNECETKVCLDDLKFEED